MNSNEAKIKIIKDTVKNSIMTQMKSELKEKISDKKKVEELLALTEKKLVVVLDSMNERELVPSKEFKSSNDLQNHILDVIKKVKEKLSVEIKKEENNM